MSAEWTINHQGKTGTIRMNELDKKKKTVEWELEDIRPENGFFEF